jgi:hypothetical protein
LLGCGKPDGISEEEYKKYKEFSAPKILYSCTTEGINADGFVKCSQIQDVSERLSCMEKLTSNKGKNTTVGYAAGVGAAVTYNELLSDAKESCRGEFEVLDSKS